jgi:hypothetical protein
MRNRDSVAVVGSHSALGTRHSELDITRGGHTFLEHRDPLEPLGLVLLAAEQPAAVARSRRGAARAWGRCSDCGFAPAGAIAACTWCVHPDPLTDEHPRRRGMSYACASPSFCFFCCSIAPHSELGTPNSTSPSRCLVACVLERQNAEGAEGGGGERGRGKEEDGGSDWCEARASPSGSLGTSLSPSAIVFPDGPVALWPQRLRVPSVYSAFAFTRSPIPGTRNPTLFTLSPRSSTAPPRTRPR